MVCQVNFCPDTFVFPKVGLILTNMQFTVETAMMWLHLGQYGMLCRLGIDQGVLLKQVISLTTIVFGCGTPSRSFYIRALEDLSAMSGRVLLLCSVWFFLCLIIWYYCPTLLSSFSLATIFAENGLHCEVLFGCFGSLQQ